MSTAPQTPQPAAKNQNRRKKVRAVMASGLVLGVGAAVTLAAWSDTVWGEGTFGTENTSFNIDGSFDGGSSWAAHVASDGEGANGPGAMTFAQGANKLIPNEPVYQLVGLLETEGNLGADIVLDRAKSDTSPLAQHVSVGVADVGTSQTAPKCDNSVTFTKTATIGADPGTMLSTEIAAEGYRWVCFSATLADGAPLEVGDKLSDAILWEFTATSKDPVA
ncbi:SipW-dependent-type signal peptide-containing protein [Dietzia maris]|uniref:SipW-dependent-type signal peptide-containing protein n=1 Tax=Dietzia maris TaxID=37915 RepID=A0AAE4TZ86_9ACTN|nr:SipW-dependent-type signal peptide-containing protein [Dietzia maris]MDV6298620.1 SipW-dependent-type signal peptide-containing protein [Dietzia maris]